MNKRKSLEKGKKNKSQILKMKYQTKNKKL